MRYTGLAVILSGAKNLLPHARFFAPLRMTVREIVRSKRSLETVLEVGWNTEVARTENADGDRRNRYDDGLHGNR